MFCEFGQRQKKGRAMHHKIKHIDSRAQFAGK